MALLTSRLAKLRSAIFRQIPLPLLMASLLVLSAALLADYQYRLLCAQAERADVFAGMSLIRAQLAGNINGSIQLVRGLVTVISAQPNLSTEELQNLAASLFREESQLRDVAIAPNAVVTMVYPLAGNEAVLGLDFFAEGKQRKSSLRARDEGQMVLAGPVDLVQGGRGLVGRFPVFTHFSGGKQFWGLVSAVVDENRLYSKSGLFGAPFDVALVGGDATGASGKQFFGPPGVLADNPVTARVELPTGSWQIAARPKGGWQSLPANIWAVRALIGTIGGLLLAPIFFAGRLLEERGRHISQLHDRQRELDTLSRRLGLAIDTSKVGVWDYNIVTGKLVWDDRMNEIYGLPADSGERSYNHWRRALHPDDFDRAAADFELACETRGRYLSDYRVVTSAGEIRNVRAMGAVYEGADLSLRIVGVNWDVSADVARNEELHRAKGLTEARNAELELAKARIEHNALHDYLTGLPNRRYLDEYLEVEAARCHAADTPIALLHLDLDRFKQINDTLGHAAGDAMLMHASSVLKANVREGDFVARIGGDEFVVVCSAAGQPRDLGKLAERLVQQMREPVAYDGHQCRFGVSIGVVNADGRNADPKRLLINADIALYRAKSRGRNRYEFFTAELQAEIVQTKGLADEILSGLERNEFMAFYQPQFDARTHRLIGVEALARWQHPQRGLLPPSAFMAAAEDLNVVATIDRIVLEQTLQRHAEWERDGLDVPRVSVNVSLRRLHDEALIESLADLHIEPGRLAFELVESIYLDESDEIVGLNIDSIKELGIDIEIDDFGTGYASIVSLLKLKPRRLKIDRQLVMPIVANPAQRQLVQSIIDIGKSLGIDAVAEGVESMQHAAILAELGCSALQGYAFAKPMSDSDFRVFARAQCWRKAS